VKAELTAREREVAARLLDGLTSKEIGKTLASATAPWRSTGRG
jgi:DNA-binding CsgD family transcriptional regulator